MTEINEQLFNSTDVKDRTINDYLLKGEKILWHEKPNAKAFVASKSAGLAPFALIWLFIDLSIIISILTIVDEMPIGIIIFLIFFFIIHLAPVWICINTMIKAKAEIKFTEYFITNKRVLVANLPSNLQVQEINIKDIQSATLNKKALDKILKVGDITITTSNKKSITLFDIKQPEKIYTIFQKIKNKFKNLEGLPEVIVCEYCGTTLPAGVKKCESCGAVHKNDD